MTEREEQWDRLRVRLLGRERELNTVMRTLAHIKRWSSATISLASSVSVSRSRDEAIQHLATSLVDNLGFDYCHVNWAQSELAYPPLEQANEIECIENLRFGSEVAEDDSAPFGRSRALEIGTAGDADHHRVRVFVAHRRETIPYIDGGLDARLDELMQILAHAFESLQLRLALIAERDSLQNRVDEATFGLRTALEKAEQTRAHALRAAQVREQFLAHMSHEIRTPLTAMLAYAELVSAAQDPQIIRSNADVITRSGRHLLELLNDILDLARIESGAVRLEPTEGSIPRLLMDVISLLGVRADELGLDLRLRFATPLPEEARVDFPRLRQILLNTVGNALKFTPTGWIEVRAFIETAGDFTRLKIEVEDTGVGIAADDLTEIFEEFRTREDSSAANQQGTGLGLTISRRLARMMGGDITVESEAGKGSCFTITVEVTSINASTWISSPTQVREGTQSSPFDPKSRFSGRILLAEDTAVIAHAVTHWLEAFGLEVEHVADGAAAIEAAMSNDFDLILLDMQMPRVNGYEAATKMKAMSLRAPIVALTAHAMAGERQRCMNAGCDDFVTKPIGRRELHDLVGRHLSGYPESQTRRSTHHSDKVLAALMGEFYDDLRDQGSVLTQALDRGDAATISQLSHRIAGSAATFGFPKLANCARRLDQAARRKRWSRISELSPQLHHEIAVVLQTVALDQIESRSNRIAGIRPAEFDEARLIVPPSTEANAPAAWRARSRSPGAYRLAKSVHGPVPPRSRCPPQPSRAPVLLPSQPQLARRPKPEGF